MTTLMDGRGLGVRDHVLEPVFEELERCKAMVYLHPNPRLLASGFKNIRRILAKQSRRPLTFFA